MKSKVNYEHFTTTLHKLYGEMPNEWQREKSMAAGLAYLIFLKDLKQRRTPIVNANKRRRRKAKNAS